MVGRSYDRIEIALRASRLLSGIDEATAATLAAGSVRRHYARGTRLWKAGDDAAWVALITSGLVKIVQPDTHGAIVAIFGAHESFGELAVVEGGAYTADAIASTREVDVICIDAAAVRSALSSRPLFSLAMNRALVVHGRALEVKVRIMSAGCVERRLAMLLGHLVDRFGDDLDDGSCVVPIALTRAELASLVGATIETTIRTMSRWRKEGFVSTLHEGFVVHRPARLVELRSVA